MADILEDILDGMSTITNSIVDLIPENNNFYKTLKTTIKEVNGLLSSTLSYEDGVSETSFGTDQESSWKTFMNGVSSTNLINFITNTPLGSSTENESLYGNMILGTPPSFTNISDPTNRAVLNSFVKDMRVLSLTPGLPKYNGGYAEQLMFSPSSTYKTQTKTFQEMIAYLKKNGLDYDFSNKDKRFYTFDANFVDYFIYLETMLNTVWVKLGLAGEGNSEKLNLFSFFFGKEGEKVDRLDSRFKSAIGFFLQGSSQISESISNQEYSNNLESEVNDASQKFQQINYLTGMGTSSSSAQKGFNQSMRILASGKQQLSTLSNNIIGPLTGTFGGLDITSLSSIISTLGNIASNVADFAGSTNISALLQQFSVTNGMQVRYPNLWSDSSYSKNINFDFEFTSPYGDPLSIFHYVYVPFFALLTFALPRQADINGFVSPFFIRADVPGLISSDLALISDMTWSKGGSSGNLFTKDGLPRSIHVSLTISDLYPFLAMTKRLSFLSANPSYTVFLDSLAGLHVLREDITLSESMEEYFFNMLNRISSEKSSSSSLNNYSTPLFSNARANYNSSSVKIKPFIKKNLNNFSVPWFTKI